ncbi:MAG TPA: GrpB family protein [Thioalkalivibrio sp.]|nr:GrpB family protein [Thioalkalivibrio sp.]
MPEPKDDSVTLVDYDPSWPRTFAREARRLESADLPGFLAVEHIGSTAVPGMSAKPIIDIMLTVTIPARSRQLIRKLEALEYRYLGNFGLRGRHFFRLGEPARVHLHVVNNRSPHARAWLEFRDTLRSRPEWFDYYEQEKRNLARLYRCDRAAYTAAKGPIVATILNATHPGKEPGRSLD